MRNTVIVFIMIIIALPSRANVSHYYKLIGKAEQQIIAGNYRLSKMFYDSAFRYSDKIVFSKDLINASKCSIMIGNSDIEKYMTLMASNGCPLSFFNSKMYKDILRNKKVIAKLSAAASAFKLKKVTDMRYHYEKLISDYDSLMRYCARMNSFNDPYKKVLAIRVQRYIEQFGFPSEQLVGPTISNDTILVLSRFSLLVGSVSEYLGEDVISELCNAVVVGKMHNMELYFLRKKLNVFKFDSPYIRYKCDIYKSKAIVNDFFELLPLNFCLPQYHDYSNAMYYNLTQNQFGFIFRTFDAIIGTFKDKSSETLMLAGYIKMPLQKLNCDVQN